MESIKKDSEFSATEDDSECETSDSERSYINENDGDDTDDDDGNSTDQADNFLDGVDFDYMAEAVKLLENHAEVNTDNAIALNRSLQDMLQTLRRIVVSMLNKCRDKYVENQTKLSNPAPVSSLLRGIGNCGAPFFKDACGRPCPPNADYIYRSDVEKELFPSDLELYPHFVWTATDKLGIVQGIKEQAIEHIERKEAYPSTSSAKKSTALSKNVKLHTLKLSDLLSQIDIDFTIDWNQISVYNLKSRHTANSCNAIWNVYLRPEINREEWTEEENVKLNMLAKKYKFQNWIAIAGEMEGRSDYQCFVQYQTVVSIKMREDKGERWTKEEDELLLTLIEKNRMGNVIRWNPICSQLPNRTKKQCFARYKYSINPTILRAPFTPKEDCIILAAIEEYGENFNCFPKTLFPNRTLVQVRNRYYNSLRDRDHIRSWTPEDDKILLHLVDKHGSHDWKSISDEIKRHSRISCRTRFLVISKFLKENPNATINDLPRKNRGPLSTITKRNWMKKIAEIKQNPNGNVGIAHEKSGYQKQCYRQRLRRNELGWYNWLKFAYDFRFGKSFSRVPDSVSSLEFVRTAFDVHLQLPIVLAKPYSNGVVRVSFEKLVRTLGQDNKLVVTDMPQVGYHLPPSYCTLLAFRGLCIQTALCAGTSAVVAVKDPDGVREAKEKFRKRLEGLLYRTALLSRLEPDGVVERCNFQVLFDPSTQLGQIASTSLAELKTAQTKKIAENLLIATRKAKRKRDTSPANSSSPKIPKLASK